ncbi:DUF58 domain-containing protein [Frankia sp. AgB1.9]|uniref:DUF58 domain-containing protein n=1 Tax=unclassified Frankia TaxID=2632575 RepID=UPI0019320C94|nr:MULTISPECIES: DUF58 domain-containing protein [unclassified Frankia]MBL7491362.1 DUF58 domain-containing protein [Frankia sp. AgW1.1]MBL7551763.1 DUF58 domain-containing protein [Frankia sp. AgB1.9]MBL7624798.1 DUF58 domain-containing protein [Frankia sp. AgB1.8]
MITRSGVAVAAIAVVFGIAGVLLGYPELVVVAAAAALALLVAGAWLLAAPDVAISREIHPERVVEGEEAYALLTVTNVSGRRCPPIQAAERVAGAEVGVALPALAAGGTTQRTYPIPTPRRGVYEIGPLVIAHSDPLRLVYTGRALPERSTLRVRPRVHPVPPLPTGGSPDLEGATSDTAPRGGVAFHSLREYVRGDDPRLIHWPSTARTRTRMVRHNVVPNEPTMLVVLDTSAGPYADDSFEDAVRVAASLVVASHTHRFPVQLRTTGGDRVAPGQGTDSVDQALDLLAGVTPSTTDPGLPALLGMAPGETGVALGAVTGQPAGSQLAAVTAARARFTMATLIMVGDPLGGRGPRINGALVVNVRTSDDFAAAWTARAVR